MKKTIAIVALAAAAGLANAQNLQETFSGLTLPGLATPTSGSTGRTYSNTYTTFNSVGGYQLGRIRMTGTLQRNTGTNTGDTPNDNRVNLWRPGTYAAGAAATQRVDAAPGSWGTVGPGGTLNVTGETIISSAFDPAGTWTYDFFNWFDDGGAPAPDSFYQSATLTFWDNLVAAPPTAYDFGTIGNGTVCSPTFNTAANQVVWMKFTLASTTNAADIFSFGSDYDTEIGLFSAGGSLIQNDDDYNLTLGAAWSRVGIGSGTGYDVDGAGPLAAFDGTNTGDGAAVAFLGAGTYYLALGGYNTSFANGFGATGGADFGAGQICINIPAPGAFALVGLGGLVAARRRRA
ncbi:MAG: hypothetical protein U0640_02760 [Phycisphaerales bacterium]